MKNVARIGLAATASLLLYACGSNPAPTDTTAAPDAQAVQVDEAANAAALNDAVNKLPTAEGQVQAQGYRPRTDIEVYKTANGYNNRTIVYDWTLNKYVSDNYLELKKNEKAVLKYKLVFNKNVASDTTSSGVNGQICVKNTGKKPIYYLLIKDFVVKDYKYVVKELVIKVDLGKYGLQPWDKKCFDYNIPLDAKYAGQYFKNIAVVYFPDYKRHYKEWNYEVAEAKFQLPQQTVTKVDDFAYLKDYLKCSDGLKCRLVRDDDYNKYGDDDMRDNDIYQDFGKVMDSGEIKYYVKVRADRKYDGYYDDKSSHGGDYYNYDKEYVKNTARLTEGDSGQVREASQYVKVIIKKGDYGHW